MQFVKRGFSVWGLAVLVAVFVTLGAGVALAGGTVVVTGNNLDVDWSLTTREEGEGMFVAGPGTPPFGIGSFEMTTTSGADKVTLSHYGYVGTPLADIDGIGYATYRSSSSTNPAAQMPALNIEVDYVGDGTSYTTLVYEPIYSPDQGAIGVDTWQTWDAVNNGEAKWWSTRTIPGVCAFNCFVTWDDILAANPNAKIVGLVGVNAGSGWNGTFSGAADGLTISVSSDATTYDFEPYQVAETKDDCKKGGWQVVRRADGSSFKNQGDCIQYVNTGK